MPTLKNGHIPQVLATEYASYRDEVIGKLSSVLANVSHSQLRPLVLYDPMAGTAPFISLAERQGYTAYFNDLNCLHTYINAAKTLTSYRTFKEIGQAKLLSIVRRMTSKLDRCPRTATREWIESSVLEGLVHAWKKSEAQTESNATLIKAILLLSVRNLSSFIKTTNPTWLKPGGLRPNISVEQAFRSTIDRLNIFYQRVYAKHSEIKGGRIILTDYDASQSAPACKADVIITSPPFCNRVDWDRMYAPEHFFLNAVGVWHTRTEFLGTTMVRRYPEFDSDIKFVKERSVYLCRFLNDVQERQIHGERRSNYYVKYYTRYFAGLFRVFDMAAKVLRKNNAGIYFAVQENNHRGLRIQINKALAESLSKQGFQVRPQRGCSWDRHHQGLQNISKHYRSVNPKQQESIWHATR